MDDQAMRIVENYIIDNYATDGVPEFEVYIVWKSKILQNWKWLISSDLHDGMYYELTYNGNENEYYLDAYKKIENKVIKLF